MNNFDDVKVLVGEAAGNGDLIKLVERVDREFMAGTLEMLDADWAEFNRMLKSKVESMGEPDLKKREWVYIQPPRKFDIAPCDCGCNEAQWSEFEGHLWCEPCQKDFIPSHNGVFDGPVPVGVAAMLGMSFDRLILSTNLVERFDINSGKYLPGVPSRPRMG